MTGVRSAGSAPVVLVADDDALRETLTMLLRSEGYVVHGAADGEETLESVRSHRPAVLVLDLGMPRRDGFEVLAELPTLDLDTQPPDTIVLTGRAGAADGMRAIRAGAIGFLTKPARAVELLALVRRALDGRAALEQRRTLFERSHKTWACSIPCRRASIRPLVNQIGAEMAVFVFAGDIRPRRVLMGLDEILANAVIHGGLEVGSETRSDETTSYETLIREREEDPAYGDRRIEIEVDLTPERVRIAVTDPGPGFDVATLPDPDDPEAIMSAHGRGILMARALVTEVRYEEGGRRVTLTQRAEEVQEQIPGR